MKPGPQGQVLTYAARHEIAGQYDNTRRPVGQLYQATSAVEERTDYEFGALSFHQRAASEGQTSAGLTVTVYPDCTYTITLSGSNRVRVTSTDAHGTTDAVIDPFQVARARGPRLPIPAGQALA